MSDLKVHQLKILPQFAYLHQAGKKPWELRFNDRDYQAGDVIIFSVISQSGKRTGEQYSKMITHVFHGGSYGLQEGYCILTLK